MKKLAVGRLDGWPVKSASVWRGHVKELVPPTGDWILPTTLMWPLTYHLGVIFHHPKNRVYYGILNNKALLGIVYYWYYWVYHRWSSNILYSPTVLWWSPTSTQRTGEILRRREQEARTTELKQRLVENNIYAGLSRRSSYKWIDLTHSYRGLISQLIAPYGTLVSLCSAVAREFSFLSPAKSLVRLYFSIMAASPSQDAIEGVATWKSIISISWP